MQIIDSHCHIDRVNLEKFGGNINSMLDISRKHNVEKFLCVSVNLDTLPQVLNLANKYDEIYASVGIHPTEDNSWYDDNYDNLLKIAQENHKVVAIGETGLDYFHIKPKTAWQIQRFIGHIEIGKKNKLNADKFSF